MTLQNASYWVSFSGRYGTWGFLPVTDGTFVQDLPSQQLLKKKVNGLNMLVGVSRYHITFRPAQQVSLILVTEQCERGILIHPTEHSDRG